MVNSWHVLSRNRQVERSWGENIVCIALGRKSKHAVARFVALENLDIIDEGTNGQTAGEIVDDFSARHLHGVRIGPHVEHYLKGAKLYWLTVPPVHQPH